MTLTAHPSAHRTFDPATPRRASRLPSGHRAASWLHAAIGAGFLAAGMAVWSVAVQGRWSATMLVMASVTFAVLAARGHFCARMVPDALAHVPLVAAAVALGLTAGVLASATPLADQPPPPHLAGLALTAFLAIVAAQTVGLFVIRSLWRRGRLRAAAVIVGTDRLARELAVELALRSDYGVDVVSVIPDPSHLPVPGLGAGSVRRTRHDLGLDDSNQHRQPLARTEPDRIIFTPSANADEHQMVRAARWARHRGLAVYVLPRLHELGVGGDSMLVDRARGYPLVQVERAAHPGVSLAAKRLFDIAVASTLLLLTVPIMAVVAVLVKATSPGPALFTQERVGHRGRRIRIHKFRSMVDSDTSETEWTAQGRVTPVGRWLRRLNIDELPQLWSIIRGDMSLVGPRPERPAFVRRFASEIDGYDERHRMPAGLTGLAQIAGLRGDTSIAERVKYDNLYIDQWTFGADLKILARTVTAVLGQERTAERVARLERALAAAGPAPASRSAPPAPTPTPARTPPPLAPPALASPALASTTPLGPAPDDAPAPVRPDASAA